MTAPSVPFSVWIWAALDPVLIGVAVYLGWKADQAGKIFVAALAALGASLLVDMVLSRLGVPWFAPLTRTGPMLLPVRAIAALVWSAVGYSGRRAFPR